MKLEINKIITLGNDEEYLIIESVTKNDKEYYYVAEVNGDKTNIKDNYKIITTYFDKENTFIEEITGENNLKEILPLFIEKMGK